MGDAIGLAAGASRASASSQAKEREAAMTPAAHDEEHRDRTVEDLLGDRPTVAMVMTMVKPGGKWPGARAT